MLIPVLLLSSACGTATDLQNTTTKAQTTANKEISEADRDADQKARDAQATANKTIAGATSEFDKLREAYRHSTTTALNDLDARIATLDAEALSANGSDKAARAGRLEVIRTNRSAFINVYNSLDQASMASWDGQRARVDARWTALKASVDNG